MYYASFDLVDICKISKGSREAPQHCWLVIRLAEQQQQLPISAICAQAIDLQPCVRQVSLEHIRNDHTLIRHHKTTTHAPPRCCTLPPHQNSAAPVPPHIAAVDL